MKRYISRCELTENTYLLGKNWLQYKFKCFVQSSN